MSVALKHIVCDGAHRRCDPRCASTPSRSSLPGLRETNIRTRTPPGYHDERARLLLAGVHEPGERRIPGLRPEQVPRNGHPRSGMAVRAQALHLSAHQGPGDRPRALVSGGRASAVTRALRSKWGREDGHVSGTDERRHRERSRRKEEWPTPLGPGGQPRNGGAARMVRSAPLAGEVLLVENQRRLVGNPSTSLLGVELGRTTCRPPVRAGVVATNRSGGMRVWGSHPPRGLIEIAFHGGAWL